MFKRSLAHLVVRAGKRAFELQRGLCFARIVARLNREWHVRCA
jgi:hypothetical protein